ncbi:cardiolipin-specific deacylase 1, mitochondrial [Trichomonascus vanleenenianus]|uniref:carboxylic ester hydrolase n=1 Tax=Trichomonascus vanleenenianus TaxID=2268995 RepID=UPI003EC99208
MSVATDKGLDAATAAAAATGTATATTATATEFKTPTPPTGVPLARVFTKRFPLSYMESYTQWINRKDLARAEFDVLSSALPYFPESDGVKTAESLAVDIGRGLYMNEFQITRVDEPVKKEVVFLHGYGAGLGFYYKNFDNVASIPGCRLHALDLLGYGRSSRPKFRITAKTQLEQVLETEDFFIDALEHWRKARNIDKFTLVAHSMGAYLSASYAKKYPGRLEKLMLVSPAGVPRNAYSLPSEDPEIAAKEYPKHNIPGWFHYLWECNVSPFSLVRNTGPLGPMFVSGWSFRRFANLPLHEATALHKYAYAIFNARGSGEYALNYLLAPGAHGRRPLAERAHEIPCDTAWVYGDRDWMDIEGGIDAKKKIDSFGRHKADVVLVRDAGHHVYLDNPGQFNKLVRDFL